MVSKKQAALIFINLLALILQILVPAILMPNIGSDFDDSLTFANFAAFGRGQLLPFPIFLLTIVLILLLIIQVFKSGKKVRITLLVVAVLTTLLSLLFLFLQIRNVGLTYSENVVVAVLALIFLITSFSVGLVKKGQVTV